MNNVVLFQTLIYLRMCLAYSAGVTAPVLESTASMREKQAPYIAKYVAKLIKENSTKPLQEYSDFIKKLMQASKAYCQF